MGTPFASVRRRSIRIEYASAPTPCRGMIVSGGGGHRPAHCALPTGVWRVSRWRVARVLRRGGGGSPSGRSAIARCWRPRCRSARGFAPRPLPIRWNRSFNANAIPRTRSGRNLRRRCAVANGLDRRSEPLSAALDITTAGDGHDQPSKVSPSGCLSRVLSARTLGRPTASSGRN
jgi:hypothetical protein